MIIVTGTKRSGTSMWMQILGAAGMPILGEAFPRDWGETLRDANEGGFYESPLRHGIYYATNPHPETGAFLHPEETARMVVKVFAQGLAKSDLAYVRHVLATMRSVREYQASLRRLYAIERAGKLSRAAEQGRPAEVVPEYPSMPPALEWWDDNYTLLRDALIRRYPLHFTSYAAVLREPAACVGEVLSWLGVGESEAALEVVREARRTQHPESVPDEPLEGLSGDEPALCDELFSFIDERRPLTGALIDRLNDAHDALEPRIAAARKATEEGRRRAQRAAVEAMRAHVRPS
jgi:hypothetical protein